MQCADVIVNHKSQPVLALVISLDVLTDLISTSQPFLRSAVANFGTPVISIPIILFWNARIKTAQKLGLLLSLCLSLGMIIVGLIKSSKLPRHGTNQDVPYEIFLIQVEASIAVLMASVSAFRPLFASNGSRAARQKQNMNWTPRDSSWKRRNRTPRSESDLETNGLPYIPSATMTDLRSLIRGGPKTTILESESDEMSDGLPLAVKKPEMLHTRSASDGEVRSRYMLDSNFLADIHLIRLIIESYKPRCCNGAKVLGHSLKRYVLSDEAMNGRDIHLSSESTLIDCDMAEKVRLSKSNRP